MERLTLFVSGFLMGSLFFYDPKFEPPTQAEHQEEESVSIKSLELELKLCFLHEDYWQGRAERCEEPQSHP